MLVLAIGLFVCNAWVIIYYYKNILVARRNDAWFRAEGVLYFDSNITRDKAYTTLGLS